MGHGYDDDAYARACEQHEARMRLGLEDERGLDVAAMKRRDQIQRVVALLREVASLLEKDFT